MTENYINTWDLVLFILMPLLATDMLELMISKMILKSLNSNIYDFT